MRFAALALLTLAGVTSAPAAPIYLALGDSSAFGETNRTRNPSNGDRGYVAPFADFLAGVYGVRPTVANFAINGETTGSYFAGTGRVSSDGQGLNTNYNGIAANPYPQYQRMRDSFSSPAVNADVRAVSVQLGANNLDAVASTPGFLTLPPAAQQALILATLGQIQADLINILGDLRARFPNADLYALGYHNPYNGDPSHPFFPLADPAVQGLNQVIAGLAPVFGARYIDVYGAISPNEAGLTLMSTWTFDPINYVHLNDAGYAAAGRQFIRTANPTTVPEPLSVAVLGGLRVGGLAARRIRARTTPAA
jgi:lysophospholipase L1-like esterase